MRKPSSRTFARLIAPALLFSAAALAAPYAHAAGDGGFAVDGYLSGDRNSDCLTLREHDGSIRYITGATDGLQTGDHVRVYGRSVNGSACNVRGSAYEVTEVHALWGDDKHKTTYYDHLTNGSFTDYAYRTNRISDQSRYGRRGRDGRSGRDGHDSRYGRRPPQMW
jgi:hypothetical protein